MCDWKMSPKKIGQCPVFSLEFLEGQGGILTARSLEAIIGKVIKISELKCVCLTYLYKDLARRNRIPVCS